MRRVALYLALLVGDRYAQALWIERAADRLSPPAEVQTYRLSAEEWVVWVRLDLQGWLPYVFDTVLQVRLQAYTEKGIVVDTSFTLPTVPQWRGALRGRFPPALAGEMVSLYFSYSEAPSEPLHARTHWAAQSLPFWIESEAAHLRAPVRLQTVEGSIYEAMPGDSVWHLFFQAACVDTTRPLPPYLLSAPRKRPPCTEIGCAWHLRGDTTRVFWTCGERYLLYGAPGGSLPLPPLKRWQEAHRMFSQRKPGERSDRGMIYLFYGEPSLRLLTPTREVWVYPQENVSFHFIWEKGDWRLIRRLEYQGIWRRK